MARMSHRWIAPVAFLGLSALSGIAQSGSAPIKIVADLTDAPRKTTMVSCYPSLVRVDGIPDYLDEITKPHVSTGEPAPAAK